MSTPSLLSFARALHRDLAENVPYVGQAARSIMVGMSRDIQTLERRFHGEGDSFITITLPKLHKHILSCVESGSFSPLSGFRRRKGSRLPCFMHGWLERIFCPTTGIVLESPDTFALAAVRQLTAFAGKQKALPQDVKIAKAIKKFEVTDDGIAQSLWARTVSTFGYDPSAHDDLHSHVDHHWRTLGDCGRYFLHTSRIIGDEASRHFNVDKLFPKHGPGAVAERLRADGKWLSVTNLHNARLSSIFPLDWVNRPFFGEVAEHCGSSSFSEGANTSRMVAVPKTTVTPRLIAAEPVGRQFWQQALMSFFDEVFSSSYLKKCIDLHDQERSQQLAREGSLSRRISTIDLSDASDTVNLDHVGALFPPGPLLHAVMVCRSDRCSLPNGVTVWMKKFATMGSAVCFPLESMVFLAACASGIALHRKWSCTTKNLKKATELCVVYGDDLIVPSEDTEFVLCHLRTLGFTPNVAKTFWRSSFRESCGGDYFMGESVKPIYLRRSPEDASAGDAQSLMSLCAFARQCHDRGLKRSRNLAYGVIRDAIGRDLPYSENLDGYLSHNVPSWDNGWILSYNRNLQRWEFEAHCLESVSKSSSLDGSARLVRYFVGTDKAQKAPLDFLEGPIDFTRVPTRQVRLRKRKVPYPYQSEVVTVS